MNLTIIKYISSLFFLLLVFLVFQNCAGDFKPHGVSALSNADVEAPFGDNSNPLSESPVSPPEAVPEQAKVHLALGQSDQFSCRLSNQGNVSCAGSNSSGQIGVGPFSMGSTESLQRIATLENVKALASGGDPTCALLIDGKVKCWGSGFGNDGFGPREVPNLVNAKAISSDSSHRCAITSGDGVACWSFTQYDALGSVFSDGNFSIPRLVPNVTAAREISSVHGVTCAIANQDQVLCWGSNAHGLIGLPLLFTSSMTPIEIQGLSGVGAKSLSMGTRSACVVTAQKTVRCWGDNAEGKLGNGSTDAFIGSVEVLGINNAVSVAVGHLSACALTEDNKILCWGSGIYGTLGQIQNTSSTRPIEVVNLPTSNFRKLYAGRNTRCAISTEDQVYCWGENTYGNMGVGPITRAFWNTPTRAFTAGVL